MKISAIVAAMVVSILLATPFARAADYEDTCQRNVRQFGEYSKYSLTFDKLEWGVIYTETNVNRDAGDFTVYMLGGTPDKLLVSCYTGPDKGTLKLIEIYYGKTYFWCNLSGIGRWQQGDCPWQPFPHYDVFENTKAPSRVQETKQVRCELSGQATLNRMHNAYSGANDHAHWAGDAQTQALTDQMARQMQGQDLGAMQAQVQQTCRDAPDTRWN